MGLGMSTMWEPGQMCDLWVADAFTCASCRHACKYVAMCMFMDLHTCLRLVVPGQSARA